jgi:hypothetical protein
VLRTRSPVTPALLPKCPRLACVKHAASVRPEPGSNSPIVISDHSNDSQINTVTLFYDSVSESRNCSDLNSPPHPERRRINEFASHNLTLRSQLSNSMIHETLESPRDSYSDKILKISPRATSLAPRERVRTERESHSAFQSPAITAAYLATATNYTGIRHVCQGKSPRNPDSARTPLFCSAVDIRSASANRSCLLTVARQSLSTES